MLSPAAPEEEPFVPAPPVVFTWGRITSPEHAATATSPRMLPRNMTWIIRERDIVTPPGVVGLRLRETAMRTVRLGCLKNF
jgi:hypothetical protein